jgi:hypothetical protein
VVTSGMTVRSWFGGTFRCRLSREWDPVGVWWSDGEGEGMVRPGGRPESAHRLRIPMVRKTEEVRQR